jgi:hypothetical protein
MRAIDACLDARTGRKQDDRSRLRVLACAELAE